MAPALSADQIYRVRADAVVAIDVPDGRGAGLLLSRSGLVVTNHHLVEGWSWGMQVGSAELTITLQRNEVLAEWTLEVRSAILRLPQANLLTFYRRCLELNRILVGCSIGVEQAGWPKPPPAQRPRGRGCRPISWATRSSLTDACSCQA